MINYQPYTTTAGTLPRTELIRSCTWQEPDTQKPGVHAVIPVKNLTNAKSRLAESFSPAERRTLAIYMFRTVLEALCAALPPDDADEQATAAALVQAVWVVSSDPLVLEMASHAGAQPLQESVEDLNAALELAKAAALEQSAHALLVLPADIPLITPGDVRDLAAALRAANHSEDHNDPLDPPRCVIVPDRESAGTNALGLTLPSELPFLFGSQSFSRHLEAAHALGLTVHIHTSPTLALDVDTPDDVNRAWHPALPG